MASIAYLHVFGVRPDDGGQPNYLMQARDGNFYGTTRSGGANTCRDGLPCGVIFKMLPDGTETTLYTFGASPQDGSRPQGSIIQGADHALYGTTTKDGEFLGGTIYRITTDGIYKTLHSFGQSPAGGAVPTAGLTLAADGNFYGVTGTGGSNHCPAIPTLGANCGTVFKLSPAGEFRTLYSFGADSTDGILPNGPLVQTSDGSFYGTTHMGGAHGRGTIFKLSPNGSVSNVHSFGATDTAPISPLGGLVVGPDGALYGTTPSGGPGSGGTVFRLGNSGEVTTLAWFGGANYANGEYPSNVLAVGTDGYLYGTTVSGGPKKGTVFRLSTTGQITTLFAFGPLQQQPYQPETGLIFGKDGALYGTTFYNEGLGGVGNRSGAGTIFRLRLN